MWVCTLVWIGSSSRAGETAGAVGPSSERGDHGALSWREGPPYYTGSGYDPARRFLRFATGWYSAELDTEKADVTGWKSETAPRSETEAGAALLGAESLPPARLMLGVRVAGTEYRCIGRSPLGLDRNRLPERPLEFPVRVIETGRWTQKVALHELEFRSAAGQALAARAYLEMTVWPNRAAFTLVVIPDVDLPAAQFGLRLAGGAGRQAASTSEAERWEAGRERRWTLHVSAAGEAETGVSPNGETVSVVPADPRARATVRWDPEEACHVVRIEAPGWPVPTEGIYPEAMLDAWETYTVEIANRSGRPAEVRIRFEHEPVHALTGCVPLWLDPSGRPAGWPLQVSKNWHHVAAGGPVLPHSGSWLHVRAVRHVPPGTVQRLGYGLTFARWGGVPAASHAQLSLVGWGHNGFWEQLALGAFGETVCLQPGRALRRALITDFRPLLQPGFARGERWAWTSNVGGADTMVRYDRAGRYVPFKRNVLRVASPGPNLARLVHEEVSADEAIHARTELLLARTDDLARVYLKIDYTVRRPVEFGSLALFQLGADAYNEPDSPRLAWGTEEGLIAEWEPGRRGELPRGEVRGAVAWASLHGQTRADGERTGQASRGLILREWKTRLGGRDGVAPWWAAARSRMFHGHAAVELTVPPGIDRLEAGDRVELLLELVALPLGADRYYGPDERLETALADGGNTWKPVWREAARNRPILRGADGRSVPGFPLALRADGAGEIGFSLEGGLGWIPVRFEGLPAAATVELGERHGDTWRLVRQGPPDRAFWQSEREPETGRWTATFNLPATAGRQEYRLRVSGATASEPVRPAEPAAAGR